MRTVFINGVFDILHVGHIDLLEYAQALGDKLIIGINSDNSVRALKPGRPINTQYDRKRMLLKIRGVYQVIVFIELNCARLLSELKPDVWLKGPDYTLANINSEERLAIEESKIIFAPRFSNLSTSYILSKS